MEEYATVARTRGSLLATRRRGIGSLVVFVWDSGERRHLMTSWRSRDAERRSSRLSLHVCTENWLSWMVLGWMDKAVEWSGVSTFVIAQVMPPFRVMISTST